MHYSKNVVSIAWHHNHYGLVTGLTMAATYILVCDFFV
jgi:hypothetical protein